MYCCSCAVLVFVYDIYMSCLVYVVSCLVLIYISGLLVSCLTQFAYSIAIPPYISISLGIAPERRRREVSWAASSVPRQRCSLNACGCSTKGAVVCTPLIRWQCLHSRHCRHISHNAHAQGPATPRYYLSWRSLENTTFFFNPLNIRIHATAHRKTQLPTQTKRR